MTSWKRLLVSLLLFGAATACSTQTVSVPPGENLRLSTSVVRLDIRGDQVAPDVIADLSRYLKAKLIVAGFEFECEPADALTVDVDVHLFDPGSAALRNTVGFGAGRGSLIYTARYLDAGGSTLAELEGEERFTGGEVHFNMEYGQFTTAMGADRVQSVLVQEAAKHIVELGLGGSSGE